jgi:hypothetical protein
MDTQTYPDPGRTALFESLIEADMLRHGLNPGDD